MTILIVDEDPVAIRVLQDVLGRAGYDVAIAFDGESALRRLRRGDIRVVIAAREMQTMTGLELCRQIRTDEAKRYTYFIMAGADARARHRARAPRRMLRMGDSLLRRAAG